MGRVVRNYGPQDDSRAYVVMPTNRIFEEYARRVEAEMSPAKLRPSGMPETKVCPDCGAECPKDATSCHVCDAEFPAYELRLKTCDACGALNTRSAKDCQACGASFGHDFEISLKDALRVGAIIRSMDLDEDEVQEGEAVRDCSERAF